MRVYKFIIGTGKSPEKYSDYFRIDRIGKVIGIKGVLKLHLHGRWWEIITPQQLHILLINWNVNAHTPVVTFSI